MSVKSMILGNTMTKIPKLRGWLGPPMVTKTFLFKLSYEYICMYVGCNMYVCKCNILCNFTVISQKGSTYFEGKMKWNEMKWNEMRWNEMKWNEMKWNEMKWNEMKWNEMKWDEMKWNEMKWNEMRWNEMKWNEMKWNEMKWNEMKKKLGMY